jgi:ABC-type lipoprotein export system ATPase subunit
VPDLRLGPGDSVLVWHDDRRLLETLARLADGTAAPRTGRLRWRGRPGPNLDDLVDALNFARTVGAFNGASRLLSHFNALQNLCLEYEYHHGAFDGTARKLALERLAGLGLTELARTPQSALSSREASALALAVILARRPSLLILERPLQLLGRPLFERLWPAVAAEAAAGGQAILALDLSAEPYSSGFFQSVVALTPAVPGGPPAP